MPTLPDPTSGMPVDKEGVDRAVAAMVEVWIHDVPPESINAIPGPDVSLRRLGVAAITAYLTWWFTEGPGSEKEHE